MSYAAYHAYCWAEGRTTAEIQEEIDRLSDFANFDWQEVGNALRRDLY